MKLAGIIQSQRFGTVGWILDSPARFQVWLTVKGKERGRMLLGMVAIGGDQSVYGTLSDKLGVSATTVGPCETIDACVERMIERWRELAESARAEAVPALIGGAT